MATWIDKPYIYNSKHFQAIINVWSLKFTSILLAVISFVILNHSLNITSKRINDLMEYAIHSGHGV